MVTGGAGFIGSHLVTRLVELGGRVTVLDDFSTGSRANLSGLDVTITEGTITSPDTLSSVLSGASYVFHLAAIPSVPRSISKPLETAWVNVWGTQLLLEQARLHKVQRVILSASSSAYGGITGDIPREESLAPAPLSPYAAQKLSTEYLARSYALALGLETLSLRYFNIFGPKQTPDSPYSAVIPKFITAALNNEEITVHGDGSQMRDFTYVDNAVIGNILAANPNISAKGDTLNIGCNKSYSLMELLTKIKTLTGKPLKIVHTPNRAGDVKFSLASLEKSTKLLSYKPVITFDQGLELTYNYYAKQTET